MCTEEGVSVKKAAKLCGVPMQTLRSRTLGHCDPFKHKSGPDAMLTASEEAALVAHVKQVATCGYGYIRREMAELVGETAFFLRRRKTSSAVNDRWVGRLLSRWPELMAATPSGVSMLRTRSATRETVDNYYRELLLILQKYKLMDKPHQIFAVDETWVSPEHIPCKVPATGTGLPVIRRQSAMATIINCTSAAGQALPPYLIYKGTRLAKNLMTGALPGTGSKATETGWPNSQVFQTYLTEHFLKDVEVSKEEPVLLLYDGHNPYVTVPLIEWALEHDIIMFMSPTHSSHFRPFEMRYYKECRNFLQQNPVITHFDISRLTASAYRLAMTRSNVIASFRCMGVFPYNASVITNEQLGLQQDWRPPDLDVMVNVQTQTEDESIDVQLTPDMKVNSWTQTED